MDHREHCDLLAAEVAAFGALVGELPPGTPVPTCPGWDLRSLALHLGGVHRWAEGLVLAQATARRPRDRAAGEPGAPDRAWILEGGETLLATLRAARPDAPMWSWGADQHVRFWSRRMLHETVVHRVDAELVGGREPVVPAAVAADGIDELLANLPARLAGSEAAAALRGRGEVVTVRATDVPAAWAIRLDADGFSAGEDPGRADAVLAGPAAGLLLALYRRRTPAEAGVTVDGDPALAERWLAHTAL
ncbi:MAG: maleylpyruvate isomerase family mycothiol-dependent enzyme [Acidimicrobiales bacterium]